MVVYVCEDIQIHVCNICRLKSLFHCVIFYLQSRTVGSLMENEVYEFAVTAVNQVGESMVNASVIIQTNESGELK